MDDFIEVPVVDGSHKGETVTLNWPIQDSERTWPRYAAQFCSSKIEAPASTFPPKYELVETQDGFAFMLEQRE